MINRLSDIMKNPKVEREYKNAFETLINYLSYKCWYEVKHFKQEEEEELLKLESYRNRLSKYEMEIKELAKENKERALLNALMMKYGIIAQPEGCPF